MTTHHEFVEPGADAARIVISSPTGQFVPWMIAAGALGVEPGIFPTDPIEEGARYATWNPKKKRMSDTTFIAAKSGGRFALGDDPNMTVDGSLQPTRRLPNNTPIDRGGAPPKQSIRDRLRNLPELKNSWHQWWGRNCLSPVVIIGDGRTYLQNQRQEILEKAPNWLTEQARALLSEDSGQTSNEERMYFHPFMVFSPEVGHDKDWLREMRPRLVIVTSWTARKRMHPSLFAGAPQILITNRRVPSSLVAASELRLRGSFSEVTAPRQPPAGIHAVSFQERVTQDLGDMEEIDEGEMEI